MSNALQSGPNATGGEWPSDGLEHLGRCPVCGSSARRLMHDSLVDHIFYCAPGRWRMHRCLGCRCGYLDPRPSAETIGRAYAEYYTHSAAKEPPLLSSSAFGGRHFPAFRNAYLNQRFPGLGLQPNRAWGASLTRCFPYTKAFAERDVRHLPAPQAHGGRLLDIGCGDGGFLLLAERLGYAAEGLEFDDKAVSAARSRGLTVHHGSLPTTGLADAAYDVVTLSQVIEHLHDPVAALTEAARLLRPDGMLWLATPNVDAFGHRRYGVHWRGLEPPRHLVLFSLAALQRALSAAGLKHVRSVPAGPVSAWYFSASEKIARGLGQGGLAPPLSFGDRIRVLVTDGVAHVRPEAGEELVVLARR